MGYATEAAQGCLEYGFKALRLKKIIGNVKREHGASQRVLEKLGMEYVVDYVEDEQTWMRFEIKNQNITD